MVDTMPAAAPSSNPADTSLRHQVYDSLREALTHSRNVVTVKLALRRLVAEGAFEMQPNRSVRVPLMTRAKILELRDIRMALEGLAAEKAANLAGRQQVAGLRRIALEIATARSRGDSVTDRLKVREFHFALYGIADQPTLQRVIEGLWLQTGPYMNLLYPDFISLPRGPETRARIIRALQSHDTVAARREIENDIRHALSYVADLADDSGNIAPAPSRIAKRRRGAVATAALELDQA